MKHSLKMLLLASALAFPIAVSAADKTEKTDSAETETQAKQATIDVDKFDKQLAKAQENMKKMQEQMDKINQTQDPQERQKLLREHWMTMQSTMPMMHGMMGNMGCPMMGGGMMHGNMMGNGMMGGNMMKGGMMGWSDMSDYYSKLTPEQMKQRQYMMDQYMPMQQMMMDNMMMHQNWMTQPSQ